MKITVTGSLGNTSRPLIEKLVQAGHQVKVVSSSDDKTAAIEALGATAAIGSIADPEFLNKAFAGADGLYAMVPPNFGETEYVNYIGSIGSKYADAIRNAGVRKVAALSSVGADLPQGTGPIAGLYLMEQALNQLSDVSVTHLRAGFFFTNFYNDVPLIRSMQIMGGNYGPEEDLVMVHPADIASAAFAAFQNDSAGKQVVYVSGDRRKTREVAAVLGTAIGQPALAWVEFSDEQALEGMEKAGFPRRIAETFLEMGIAIRNKQLFADYDRTGARPQGTIRLEDFAREFAERFQA